MILFWRSSTDTRQKTNMDTRADPEDAYKSVSSSVNAKRIAGAASDARCTPSKIP